jgi:hypothetical protein
MMTETTEWDETHTPYGALTVAERDAPDLLDLQTFSVLLSWHNFEAEFAALRPNLARTAGSLRSMSVWLQSQTDWADEELRLALRCTLNPNESLLSSVSDRRLERCEDFLLFVCNGVKRYGDGNSNLSQQIVRFCSDTFVLAGFRVENANAAFAPDSHDALDLVRTGDLAAAYRTIVGSSTLFRPSAERKPIVPPDSNDVRWEGTSRNFLEGIGRAKHWLNNPVLGPLSLAGIRLKRSDLYSACGLKNFASVDSIRQVGAWEVSRRAATLHNGLVVLLESSYGLDRAQWVARVVAMCFANASEAHFDVARPMVEGLRPEGTVLVREAYQQATKQLVERTSSSHRTRDAEISAIFRAAIELWRYQA